MPLLKVKGDIYAHDPVIVKENGIYFRFQTGNLLPFFVSKNLHDWKFCGTVFSENPLWCAEKIPGCSSLWAPEVIYRNGEWRIYYAVSTFGKNRSAIGMVVSKILDQSSSLYKWFDKGPILESSLSDNFNAIDPAVIRDTENNDWLLWGSFWDGLKIQRLDAGGIPVKKASVFSVASRKTDPNPVEGGYIIFRDKWYYLFASHDFCCRGTASTYHIVVGRSEKITGPYFDKIGADMMAGGGTVIRDGFSYRRWAGPGHNSVFIENNKYYLVYHAYDRKLEGVPSLQIELFDWDAAGWPVF